MATRKPGPGGADKDDVKQKGTTKYPPYVNAYGAIPSLFAEISKASVPPKFTQDFMESVLGMRSSSHRALIPLLKKLGFIDAANVPTEAYKSYRDSAQAGAVMAQQLRGAYNELYRANEYAHTLPKDQLSAKLKTVTGAAERDPYIPSVVSTFLELRKLADFDAAPTSKPPRKEIDEDDAGHAELAHRTGKTGAGMALSYTINLNLPATTDIDVFNAIFKSLREHLLNED